jgi:hypothetical protein
MKLLDFIDKYTQWLDLSWMVTRPKKINTDLQSHDTVIEQQHTEIPNNIVNYNDKISLLDKKQKYDYNTLPKFES